MSVINQTDPTEDVEPTPSAPTPRVDSNVIAPLDSPQLAQTSALVKIKSASHSLIKPNDNVLSRRYR